MAEEEAKSESSNPSGDPCALYRQDGLISRALRKGFPPNTERAYTEREVGIEKTIPSEIEEKICTRRSRRKIRVEQSNTSECTKSVG